MVHYAIVKDTIPYLYNPFAEANPHSKQDEKSFRQLVEDGPTPESRHSALLNLGHMRVQKSPDEDPLADLTPKHFRKLPYGASDYRRLLAAASRCFHKLCSLRGSSAHLRQVRQEVWAACFGQSLDHTLALEEVIRDQDILLLGETGTGKELLAQAIQVGMLAPKGTTPAPASALNAAAIPESLVESELFGHVRGAFTGATETRMGALRKAHKGAFFLDEIGDLPIFTQVKLLRVIETDQVVPLGSDESHPCTLRYVAATHKDLHAMVQENQFRRDLYQRLAGNVITLPPLRERPEDMPDIAVHFIKRYDPELTGPRTHEALMWVESTEARNYPWPGNVRELQNALRNLLLGLAPDLQDLTVSSRPLPAAVADASASLREAEEWYVRHVVAHTGGNLSQTARILGVDRGTVKRKLHTETIRSKNR